MKGKFAACLLIALAFSIACSFVNAQDIPADTLQITDSGGMLCEQTPIWLIDRTAEDVQNSFAVGTIADVSEYVGRELYYPTYGTENPQSFISVIYSVKQYTVPAGKTHNTIQMNIMGTIDYFWIDIDETPDIVFEAQDIAYEQHGTVFKIREREPFDAPYGNYHVIGNLEECCYTFYADTVDEAKTVINGLTKQ